MQWCESAAENAGDEDDIDDVEELPASSDHSDDDADETPKKAADVVSLDSFRK